MASRDGISIGSHQGRAGRHPSDSFYAAPCFIIHSASQLCRPDDQSEQNRTDGTGHATQNSATRHFLSFPPPAATAQPFVGGQSLLLLSSTSSRVCASNCVLGHCRSSGTTTDEYIFESAYMEWEKSLLLEFHSPSRFVHTLYSLNTHTIFIRITWNVYFSVSSLLLIDLPSIKGLVAVVVSRSNRQAYIMRNGKEDIIVRSLTTFFRFSHSR